ncbi:3-oxoacyl-ACP synthase [Flavobacterium sp. KMS]|uniref:3-oxoacyl-ACP synthase n=1 Tax=Flavobacterium sp. KMS TaxID=1566023 RepID=UPI00057E5E21|nr:3-oxoacyl-ACP synthase [Flavobacterium sp. KMS]KIA98077.1 3-oxoacyl-ACP synthase [Flavobacterium sp. KMS]
MTQNKTYIQSYCAIQNNEIVLNEASVFKTEPTLFADFSKQAYRNFEINYPKFFKMDSLSKLAFLGAELLLKSETESDPNDSELAKQTENNTALLLANKSSSLDTDVKYQESISDKENYYPSPAVFVYTLPNICLGEISIRHQLKSENSFFIFDAFNPEFMNSYANTLLHTNKAEKVLCGWVEFFNEEYKAFLCLIGKDENHKYQNETIETLYNK